MNPSFGCRMSLRENAIVTDNWQCPNCLAWSSLDKEQYSTHVIQLSKNADGLSTLRIDIVVCKNIECCRSTISADLISCVPYQHPGGSGSGYRQTRVRWYQLVPASKARSQPSYIPQQIVADYEEAYLIASLSPKASATLSRRCLQGMIRDYFGVSKATLYAEITAIRDKTPDDVWDAIDAVRKIGNIGAHMEKDIDVIVDVDQDEAKLLLELIEQLFDDWYVTRHKRKERLKTITDLALVKAELKKAGPESDGKTVA